MERIGKNFKELLTRMQDLMIESTKNKNESQLNESKRFEQLQENTKIVDCKVCHDENGYLIFENGLELWKICECVHNKKIKRLMKASKITDEFAKLTFSNFITEGRPIETLKARDIAYQYCKDFNSFRSTRSNSISLLGQVGGGKTHLLSAISNNFLSKGIQVIYFPYVEGMTDLKSNMDELELKINELKKCEVLFIDDLFKGSFKVTEFELKRVYEIINYRYMNFLPILVSSEKNFEDLLAIDEAIGSRLFEMSNGHRFVMKGLELNYRMRK